jgi:hypothetical protein
MAYMWGMPGELHVVAELPQFVRDADRMGLSAHELQAIVSEIAADPLKQTRFAARVGFARFALPDAAKARAAAIVW